MGKQQSILLQALSCYHIRERAVGSKYFKPISLIKFLPRCKSQIQLAKAIRYSIVKPVIERDTILWRTVKSVVDWKKLEEIAVISYVRSSPKVIKDIILIDFSVLNDNPSIVDKQFMEYLIKELKNYGA